MTRSEYAHLISNSRLKEPLLKLFDIFEIYCIESPIKTQEQLTQMYQALKSKDISAILKELRSYINDMNLKIMLPYMDSLNQNISQFITRNMITETKWKKIINSYINVSRLAIDAEKIEKIIKDGCPNNEKIIIAISMIDITQDDINVSKEIDDLVSTASNYNKYWIIPAHGCSTNVFRSMVQRFKFDMLHIAGHSSFNAKSKKYSLLFTDSNMTYNKFKQTIPDDLDFIFINCCNSYEFTNGEKLSICGKTIVHNNELSASIAKNFSETYYSSLFILDDLNDAWLNAIHVENPLQYILI